MVGCGQDPGPRLRRLPYLVPVEGAYLLPVDAEHPVGQFWYWNDQRIVWLRGQVLDAVFDQSHQRRQFVRGRAKARLQDRHHAPTQEQRITGHGDTRMSEPASMTTLTHYLGVRQLNGQSVALRPARPRRDSAEIWPCVDTTWR
jgi:hypothetical protein